MLENLLYPLLHCYACLGTPLAVLWFILSGIGWLVVWPRGACTKTLINLSAGLPGQQAVCCRCSARAYLIGVSVRGLNNFPAAAMLSMHVGLTAAK